MQQQQQQERKNWRPLHTIMQRESPWVPRAPIILTSRRVPRIYIYYICVSSDFVLPPNFNWSRNSRHENFDFLHEFRIKTSGVRVFCRITCPAYSKGCCSCFFFFFCVYADFASVVNYTCDRYLSISSLYRYTISHKIYV